MLIMIIIMTNKSESIMGEGPNKVQEKLTSGGGGLLFGTREYSDEIFMIHPVLQLPNITII